jgi:hypothetical protein
VIGEARRVGVVLLDTLVGFMIQQAIKHVGRIAYTDVYDIGVERCILIGDVGIERPSWVAAVFGVNVAGALGLAAGTEILAV